MQPADPPPELPPPPSRAGGLRAELALVRDFAVLPAVGVVVFWVAYAVVTAGAHNGSGFYCAGGLHPLATVAEIYLGLTFVASLVFGRRRIWGIRLALVASNLLFAGFFLVMSFALAWTGTFSGVNCGA